MSKNVIIPYHPAFSPPPTTNPFLSTTTHRAARTPQRQRLALQFGVGESCGSKFKIMGLYSRFWKRSFAAVDRSQNCASVFTGARCNTSIATWSTPSEPPQNKLFLKVCYSSCCGFWLWSCMYVRSSHIARVWINRVKLPILLVVS